MHLPHSFRRLAVTAVVPVLIGTAVGSPAAATSTPSPDSDGSYSFSVTITEESLVDVDATVKGKQVDSMNCDTDDIEDRFSSSVKVQAKLDSKNDTCTLKASGMTVREFNNYFSATIEHDNEAFSYEDHSYLTRFDEAEISVTFPGKVSRVSGGGKRSGSTATWKNAENETATIEAMGADHGTPPYPAIIIGILMVFAAVGGLSYYLLVVRKRKQTAYAGLPMNPGAAQPGYTQPGAPQPGYAQPGAPQPGYAQPDAPQPGYAQPGTPQPGYAQPGQPGTPLPPDPAQPTAPPPPDPGQA